MIAIPGPSVLLVVSRAIAAGRAAGVATVAGNSLGAFTQVIAVAFGIGPLVERSLLLFNGLKLAGACYLVYLGIRAVRHRHSLADSLGAAIERKTTARISDSAWALAAGTARAWLSGSPRRLALLGGTGGLAMIAIGTRLAFSGRAD